jgi:alpha-beta hydrolase superfamily lysophospholipase
MLQQVQKPESRNRQDDAVERTFATHDGTELFYRFWPARTSEARGAIVLFHRGHEHGARMAHLVDELDMPDYAFYAWDARGHGRSPGKRGYSPSFAASVRDVDCFIKEIAERDGFTMTTSRSWRSRLARCWRRLGCMTMPQGSGRWCSPPRPSA